MRMMGLEPIRSHLRKILSLVRLPFRHIRLCLGAIFAPELLVFQRFFALFPYEFPHTQRDITQDFFWIITQDYLIVLLLL